MNKIPECDESALSDSECPTISQETYSDALRFYCAEPETACGHVTCFSFAVGMMLLVIMVCPVCVWGVLVFSCFFCLQYRSLNLVLWACIVVLWLMGWRFNLGQGLVLQWS